MARPPITDRSKVQSKVVRVRITPAQRKRWVDAAHKQGITLSLWARAVLDRAARTG